MKSFDALKKHYPHLVIEEGANLSKLTYTKVGGAADWLIMPTSRAELVDCLAVVKALALPLTILGNASNLIVQDGGIRGVVLVLTQMTAVELDGPQMKVQAGAKLVDISQLAAEHGLGGLEFACGIPGSIGGAVYMNAGAYGGEMSDVISEVEALTYDGELRYLTRQDLDFAYRHSRIQEEDLIVTGVTFHLDGQADKTAILARMAELTALRQAKQPLEYPSCGSVFKRPEGHFTGKLIQDAGLQGYQIGGAQVSLKHAGFIVNLGGATASDYIALIGHIQEVVKAQFGVSLEPEVRILGEPDLK